MPYLPRHIFNRLEKAVLNYTVQGNTSIFFYKQLSFNPFFTKNKLVAASGVAENCDKWGGIW